MRRLLCEDLTPLLLRLCAGLIFLPHGYAKVFGHGGAAAFAHDLPSYGIPAMLGYVAAYAEFFGALLLVVGLLTRLSALLLAATMAVAAFVVQLPDALHETDAGSIKLFVVMKGIELPLALLAIATALLCVGGGRFSLDRLLRVEQRAARVVRRRESAATVAPAV